jgi:pimeloyl-ACP methyl ester carboxylesterase
MMLYFHGNAEDIGICRGAVKSIINNLNAADKDVAWHGVAVEYAGYGPDAGSLDDSVIADQALYVIEHLQYALGVASGDIVLCGRSIGTGVACQVMAQLSRHIRALVLISPFTSLRDVAGGVSGLPSWMLGCIMSERYDNQHQLSKITSPVLMLHGEIDRLIPASHSKKLFKKCAAKSKHRVLLEGGHNNLCQDTICDEIAKFALL